MKLTALFLFTCIHFSVVAQEASSENTNREPASPKETATQKKKMNFFIISKPTKVFDPASRFNIIRAKLKSLFRHKDFVCIVAGSTEEMSRKVRYRLRKYNAEIGSIWFDSHGSYKKGYSFFTVGNDEISFKNVSDTAMNKGFQELAHFCTEQTRVGIGSCYGGATYSRPGSDQLPHSKMNGDSLMIGMGKLFPMASIYASQSWVMTKPGLFKKRPAMEGFPLRRKFRDVIFEPVWKNVGSWNRYTAADSLLKPVTGVVLDKKGNIWEGYESYLSKKKATKRLVAKMRKLKPALLKI